MDYRLQNIIYGQTLYDLALQVYGHVDGVFLLLEDNEGVVADLSDVPQPGTVMRIRATVPQLSDDNLQVVADFALRELEISSQRRATNASVLTQYFETGYINPDYI